MDKQRTKLSEDSKKAYSKYQHIYKTYLDFHKFNTKDKDSLVNFFFLMSYHYARSTLWTMYSAIWVWYLTKHQVEVKMWPNVLDILKAITKNHVAKKSMVFSKDQMKKIFNYLENKIKEPGFVCRIDNLKNYNRQFPLQHKWRRRTLLYRNIQASYLWN